MTRLFHSNGLLFVSGRERDVQEIINRRKYIVLNLINQTIFGFWRRPQICNDVNHNIAEKLIVACYFNEVENSLKFFSILHWPIRVWSRVGRPNWAEQFGWTNLEFLKKFRECSIFTFRNHVKWESFTTL